MALYRFTGHQTQVFCGLQAEDRSTLVCEPGQIVDTVNLDDSLAGFFEPAGPAGKKQTAVKATAVTEPAPAADPEPTTAPADEAKE